MGNKPGKFEEKESNLKSPKKVNKKIEISPFREGLSGYTQSPLLKYIKNATYDPEYADPYNQNSENENINEEEIEKKEMEKLENKYFSNNLEEFNIIKKDFEMYSKENKMAKRKLLDYFGLIELDNTKFGNRFFNCVKGGGKLQGNNYLDLFKFAKAIAMLSKNSEDRLKFLYTIFDLDSDGFIEKDEMLNVFTSFYEAMTQVEFENPDLNNLKFKIMESSEPQIGLAMQDIVNEIYDNFQTKPGVLFYDEWKKWILEEPGMREIIFNDYSENHNNISYNNIKRNSFANSNYDE